MATAIESLASLIVGVVDSVTAASISASLELEAPQSVALATGIPTTFPKISGYLLIPNQTGAVVVQIKRLSVERSPFPKRPGFRDFGLVDMPFPMRRLDLTPVGTLKALGLGKFKFSRGVESYPSIGDQVILATEIQLKAIVELAEAAGNFAIGRAPLAANAVVRAHPDRLFPRHLAVLGNTGSGKSCSVAGIVRWSLEEAKRVAGERNVNARFILLDPNGEYSRAFRDLNHVRIFALNPRSGEQPLQVPAWFWNSYEWDALLHSQPGTQKPILHRALRDLRNGADTEVSGLERLASMLRMYEQGFRLDRDGGKFQGTPAMGFHGRIVQFRESLSHWLQEDIPDAQRDPLSEYNDRLQEIAGAMVGRNNFIGPSNYASANEIVTTLGGILDTFPAEVLRTSTITEDSPVRFDPRELADRVRFLAIQEGGNMPANLAPLALRIESLLRDQRLVEAILPTETGELVDWLTNYVGANQGANGNVAVVDLSLMPSEHVHIVISVVARIVFEASQRYAKHYGSPLPTTLILEDAHTFIKRSYSGSAEAVTPSSLCCEVFEKIAREGRKFGLGLVLSSQRPSELSSTVLSQCNTFLLHRLVNDEDQRLVSRLVPDALGDLLEELPSLPTRHAILLGWATELPILVEMRELDSEHQPHSKDPLYWKVWTGEEPRPIDWPTIVSSWQGTEPRPAGGQDAGPATGVVINS
jgi:hypothetical protein